VRVVRVAADVGPNLWTLRIGGWPVAADAPPEQQEDPGAAAVYGADGLASRVIALHGALLPGVYRPAGAHAFGRHAAVPYLRSAAPVRAGESYAVAVALSADPAGFGEPPRFTAAFSAAGRLTAKVRWAGGEQDMLSLR
jgi:hypothetical protein